MSETAQDDDPGRDAVRDPVTGTELPDRIRLPPLATDRPPVLLVIDNYDSFTYNLVQYLEELGATTHTVRNDAITPDEAKALAPDGIVISPGPGNPKNERDFRVSGPILRDLSPHIPTLGVCLGLQGFAAIYGGDVTYAKDLMHGKTSRIEHDGEGIFRGVRNPLNVGRYHSLVADPAKIPAALTVTARTTDGEIMGLAHRTHPIHCVQFHPESILTEDGKLILRNFLEIVIQHRADRPDATQGVAR